LLILQDEAGTLLDSNIPDVGVGSDLVPAAGSGGSGSGGQGVVGTTTAVMSFKFLGKTRKTILQVLDNVLP